MKNKTLGLILMFLGLAMVIYPIVGGASMQLLQNPDFSNGTANWTYQQDGVGNSGSFSVVDGVGTVTVTSYESPYPSGYIILTQYLSTNLPETGAQCRLTFRYKGVPLQASVHVWSPDVHGEWVGGKWQNMPPTNDWTNAELDLTMPGQGQLGIRFWALAVGKMELDDVSFDVISNPTPTPTPSPAPQPDTWTIQVRAEVGGSVDPVGLQTLNVGDTFTATATANEGYEFAYWMFHGPPAGVKYYENPFVLQSSGFANDALQVVAVFKPVNNPPPPSTGGGVGMYGLLLQFSGGLVFCCGLLVYRRKLKAK